MTKREIAQCVATIAFFAAAGILLTFWLATAEASPASDASGGPVARPSCSNAPKAGTVELDPNGTSNAISFVEFATPFCSGPVVIVATISNQSTDGESVGAQAIGLAGAAVSLRLGEDSQVQYGVNWIAVRATQ